jgi:hypothetical protein
LKNLALALLVACGGGGGPSDGGTDGGPPNVGFTPSNVDVSKLDTTGIADVTFTANGQIQTDQGGSMSATGGFRYAELTQGFGRPKLGVFVVRSLTVASGVTVSVQGADALVVLALDHIDVSGTLLGNSTFNPLRTAPGAVDFAMPNALGQGLGGGGAATGDTSGGGGGFCGHGGAGATLLTTPAAGGTSYGTANLIPLLAGSGGGNGALSESVAGGAIELVAANAITVSGAINVGGRGGGGGGTYMAGSSQEASGGGSGGAILLESQTVTVTGTLAANGGGGGQGNHGARGADATPDATAAPGGNDGTSGSPGGNGSGGFITGGLAGQVAASTSAGGGGGGAGWIRINTSSGTASLGGTFSPSQATTCLTQGQLAP